MLFANVVQIVLDDSVRKIFPALDQKQAEDQAGFRKTYHTTDHLVTYRMIDQKCHDWRIKMWTATVDFTQAFDSTTHNSIWNAIKSCGIEHDYISLLKKIFRDQKASVQTDEESNIFYIRKGTKQGDPLFSLLFNTVLQYSLKDEIQRWQKKRGIVNLPERPGPRVPHKPEIRRRRATVRNIQRTASENVVWIQEKY